VYALTILFHVFGMKEAVPQTACVVNYMVTTDRGNLSQHGPLCSTTTDSGTPCLDVSTALSRTNVLRTLIRSATYVYIRLPVVFLAPGTLLPPPTTVCMAHRFFESNWKPPSIDRILCNFDRIYAAGVFWRVVSPQLLESQSRLISAIALIAEKLKATLHPQDQSLPENRHRRYAPRFDRQNGPFICPHRFFVTPPSPQTKRDPLTVRHQRELRLYTEAVKRVEKRSTLDLKPTTTDIAFAYNQLAVSLDFWEDAKFWYGMPWWRKPHFDFPWAPPRPLSGTLDRDLPGRPLLSASNDPQRAVTFGEGEKVSSLKAPALTRVPRCSAAAHSGHPVVRAS